MGEPVPQDEKQEIAYSIPDTTAKVWGTAVNNLLTPKLKEAKTLAEQLPPENDEERQMYQDWMKTDIDPLLTLLDDLQTKKITILEVNGGFDFKPPTEVNTANLDLLVFPLTIDKDTYQKLKVAFRHKYVHTGASLSYATTLPKNHPLYQLNEDITNNLDKMTHSPDIKIILDENNEPQLQFENLKESIPVPSSTASALGAGLQTELQSEVDALPGLITGNDIFSLMAAKRNIAGINGVLEGLQTAETVSLNPKVGTNDYELDFSPEKKESEPILDTVITRPLLLPLTQAVAEKLSVFVSGLLQNSKTLNLDELADVAKRLQEKVKKLKSAEEIRIQKDTNGKAQLEIVQPKPTESITR